MDTRVQQLEEEVKFLRSQLTKLLGSQDQPAATKTLEIPTAASVVVTTAPVAITVPLGHVPDKAIPISSPSHPAVRPMTPVVPVTSSPNKDEGDELDGTSVARDSLSIEEKKNLKRVLISKNKLAELKRQRSIKLADLVRIPVNVPMTAAPPLVASSSAAPLGEWPLELVLVRHGQSEGNEAVARSQHGDLSAYTPEFQQKHSSTYRLTDKGIQQAQVAGQWIRENIGDKFDRYYTSEYVRAMETSALLDLPNAKWYTEIVLRERDKGKMDNTSAIAKKTIFADEMERRKRDAFFWAPPGGESLADVCIRVEHTFNTLRRDCSNQRVIIVCHGEVMWAFRVRIERLSQIRFHQLQASKDPKDAIHNTQVLHYSRIHPVTGEVFPYFRFLRNSCPWKPEFSSDSWMEFERPIYTNEELLESVHSVPRYVNKKMTTEENPEDNNY